jgi:hypothetical protein
MQVNQYVLKSMQIMYNLCKLCIIYAILCIFWIYSQYSMNVSSKQAMIPGDPDRGRTGDLLRDREAC